MMLPCYCHDVAMLLGPPVEREQEEEACLDAAGEAPATACFDAAGEGEVGSRRAGEMSGRLRSQCSVICRPKRLLTGHLIALVISISIDAKTRTSANMRNNVERL